MRRYIFIFIIALCMQSHFVSTALAATSACTDGAGCAAGEYCIEITDSDAHNDPDDPDAPTETTYQCKACPEGFTLSAEEAKEATDITQCYYTCDGAVEHGYIANPPFYYHPDDNETVNCTTSCTTDGNKISECNYGCDDGYHQELKGDKWVCAPDFDTSTDCKDSFSTNATTATVGHWEQYRGTLGYRCYAICKSDFYAGTGDVIQYAQNQYYSTCTIQKCTNVVNTALCTDTGGTVGSDFNNGQFNSDNPQFSDCYCASQTDDDPKYVNGIYKKKCKYTNKSNLSTSCDVQATSCDGGYCVQKNSPICRAAGFGFYSPRLSTTCETCPKGTTTTSATSTSQTDCGTHFEHTIFCDVDGCFKLPSSISITGVPLFEYDDVTLPN